jgi:hypothetical protein
MSVLEVMARDTSRGGDASHFIRICVDGAPFERAPEKGVYRHWRHGALYVVLGYTKHRDLHYVVYMGLAQGKVWIRPGESWNSLPEIPSDFVGFKQDTRFAPVEVQGQPFLVQVASSYRVTSPEQFEAWLEHQKTGALNPSDIQNIKRIHFLASQLLESSTPGMVP